METIYECTERTCFNRAHHFHSNQCYVGCTECYPPEPKKDLSDLVVKVLFWVMILFGVITIFCYTMAAITSVTGKDGTYQQCLLPVEEHHGFKCNNITRDEFYRDYKLDGSIAPDGREYWYVSFE